MGHARLLRVAEHMRDVVRCHGPEVARVCCGPNQQGCVTEEIELPLWVLLVLLSRCLRTSVLFQLRSGFSKRQISGAADYAQDDLGRNPALPLDEP